MPLILCGFFGSLYSVGVNSPAATDFFRELGASEFQFGLISGLPLMMIFMQFVGAAVLNRVPRRKPIFVGLSLAYRLLYLGVAFLPEGEFAPHIEDGRLVRVLQDWCPPFSGYHLYYPSRRQPSPAFALVLKALIELSVIGDITIAPLESSKQR